MTNLIPTSTELHLFDIHTYLEPLLNSELFTTKFRFLGLPLDYDDNYEDQELIIRTEHFSTIKPLRVPEIKANHFWTRLPSQKAWYAHHPLVGTPANLSVNLVAENLGLNLPVQTSVFLWPWGWSTNLWTSPAFIDSF